MSTGSKWLLSGLIALIPSFSVFSQILKYDSGYTYRELTPGTDGVPSSNPSLGPYMYHNHDMTGFDDRTIWEGTYRSFAAFPTTNQATEFMNWRMILPKNYSKKPANMYPMILMLHGAGEGGRVWSGSFNYATNDVRYDNNSMNDASAGPSHLVAVNKAPTDPKAFPGIVVFPQASYNAAWESNWDNGNQNPNSLMVAKIVEYMISNMNADPDRIYIHGLSNGAKGTWDFASKRPDLIAAMAPMSGVPSDPNNMVVPLVTTPIWLFQGGIDTNPRPQASYDAINVWNKAGGVIRFTLYPTLGHGTWTTAYAEPDFFSWLLSQSKKNIYVFGGDPRLCPNGQLTLGFSANMTSYQWTKDGVDIPSETTRYLTVTQVGTYRMRYRRKVTGSVDQLSNPLVVTAKPASTYSPPLTYTSSNYESVDVPGVINYLTLVGPTGFSNYQWFKNGTSVTTTDPLNDNILLVNTDFSTQYGKAADAGSYTLSLTDAGGCASQLSAPLTVYYQANQPTSNLPTTPTLQVLSTSSIKVTWPDYSNEVSYELYRYRKDGPVSGGPSYTNQGWTLISNLPAGTTSYTDKGLRPNAKYQYVIRALLADGTSRASAQTDYNDLSGFTNADTSAPTVPTGLYSISVGQTDVKLGWTASNDDDLVYKYEIYNGSTLVTTVTGVTPDSTAHTQIDITGLVTSTNYIFTVRAIDFTGNASALAEGVSVTTLGIQNGLNYRYFTLYTAVPGATSNKLVEPSANGNINFTTATPAKTGVVTNFDLTGAGTDNYFVYEFTGYLNITAGNSGGYVFAVNSAEGARLYIRDSLVVNNDNAGSNKKYNNATVTTPPYAFNTSTKLVKLPVGKHKIRLTYYYTSWPVNGNKNPSLIVSYKKGTGASGDVAIPASLLYTTNITLTDYYLVATVGADPSLLTSWTTSSTGVGGTAPASFTADYQYFHLQNQTPITIANPWTVSGNGSKIIVETGVTTTIAAAVSGNMDLGATATVNVNNAAFPSFKSLNATSTVNFNIAGNSAIAVPNATYGNVAFQSANPVTFSSSTTTIQGNMTAVDGVTTAGLPTNLTTLKIGGNLTFSNTAASPFPSDPTQKYSLIFMGGKTHTITFGSAVDPSFVNLQADYGDSLAFVNPGTARTYTFGSSIGGGLNLRTGSKLNVGANNNVVVTGLGTVNNTGETGGIAITNGDFTLNSTSSQPSNINFVNKSNTLNNFSVSIPASTTAYIQSAVSVKNLLTLGGGQLNTGADANVLLLSDGTNGTARIAPIPSGSRISGSIAAQRYMENKSAKIYQYISSPVKLATAAMLQKSFPITGSFTGHDVIAGVTTSAASMFWYNEPGGANAYLPFPATGGTNADTMKVGRGYTAYVRKTDGPTTWQVQGNPNQGNISFTSLMTAGTGSPNDGWNLIGNPYPSPIVWSGSATAGWSSFNNLSSTVYVRENNASGYQWHVYRPGITAGDLITGQSILAGGVIASGQAFWVQASGVPSLAITESAKQTTDGQFYRTNEAPVADVMSITLSNGTLSDIAFIAKSNTGDEAYQKTDDAVKQLNSTFNLSTLSKDNVPLVINSTSIAYCEKNTRIGISNASTGNYSMTFKGMEAFQTPVNMELRDKFLGTSTAISPGYVHNFSITSDSASAGNFRFVLWEKPVVTTGLSLAGSSVCEVNPRVTVSAPQSGVYYKALFNGLAVSDSVTSAGGDSLILTLNKKLLGSGTHSIHVSGGFAACDNVDIGQAINVTVDSLQAPVILFTANSLQVQPKNADKYQWLLDGKILKDNTSSSVNLPNEGAYQVIVTEGSCVKTSPVFAITGLGESSAFAASAFPNPFTDKFTVTLPESAGDGKAVLYNVMGQPVQTTSFTSSGSNQAELRFSNVETGTYILAIGVYKIKVVKIN